MTIENLPLPSTIRYRIEQAPRRAGNPQLPGAPWRTVRGKTGMTVEEAKDAIQQYPSTESTIYRLTSYKGR